MRTAAFAIIATAVVVVAAVTAAAVLRPTSYLYSPPRVDARCEDAYVPRCEDAYVLRAAGTLAWLTLEGGMWEFETNGKLDGLYDLYGVPGVLPADRIAWLQDHPGTGVPARVEGIAEPCLPTFHMHGVVVRLTALDA